MAELDARFRTAVEKNQRRERLRPREREAAMMGYLERSYTTGENLIDTRNIEVRESAQ